MRMRQTIPAVVVVLVLTITALAADDRREIQFPDLPGCVTLKCDFHMHTVFSDGLVWPTVRVDEAWREGLDAIAITDHIEYRPHKEITADHNHPYELMLGRAKDKGILLIRGAEITRDTPPGHFNAIFLSDVVPLDTKEFYDVFDRAAEQSAFVFWNHPGWQGPERGQWGEEQTRLLEKKQLHGIEICNGTEYYEPAHRWALEKNLALIGNSDIHIPSPWAEPTPDDHRTLTLVFARQRSLKALREALDAGRTAVWCENRVIGREEYLKPMFDACVEVRPVHNRFKENAWCNVHNRCELNIELERDGKHGGPARITLPARSTALLKFDPGNDASSVKLAYRVRNFLVAPDEALRVTLAIRMQATATAPAGAY